MDAITSSTDGAIAPGLLQVFRLAIWIRLAFLALALAVLALLQLPGQGVALFTLGETMLMVGALYWSHLRVRLGSRFLPLMLGWTLASTIGVRLVVLVSSEQGVWAGGQFAWLPNTLLDEYRLLTSAGFNLAWMAVPVVLATWQYGYRGLWWSMAAVIAGSLAPVLLFSGSRVEQIAGIVDVAGRLAIIGLVAIVVERLVTAQRHEQQALEAAHRELARRAATVEQLAESRERNRLAREMHDTLAHSLTGISVQLQALGKLMETDPAAAQAQLRAAQSTVRDGVAEARRAIQALRASPLADLGLVEALRQLCRTCGERLEIALTCDVAEVGMLEPAVEQAIYRTAEGALANVERHANAARVALTLARRGAGLTLTIADDGMGFDPASVAGDRYGLAGMRDRALAIGATLTVTSAPARGTVVTLECPLEA